MKPFICLVAIINCDFKLFIWDTGKQLQSAADSFIYLFIFDTDLSEI